MHSHTRHRVLSLQPSRGRVRGHEQTAMKEHAMTTNQRSDSPLSENPALEDAVLLDAAVPAGEKSGLSVLSRAIRTGQARLGLVLLALVALLIVFGRFLARYAPDAIVGQPLEGPTGKFPLGTDILGRDVLSRLLYGGFSLSWMAILAAGLGVFLGCLVGLTAAYKGGAVDALLMRAMDVLLSFPDIIFVLLFVSMLGRSTF